MLSITLLLLTSSSHAVFQDIWKGYIASKYNKKREIQLDQSISNFGYNKSLYDWNLSLSTGYDDSNLAALFAFQSLRTINTSYGYRIEKPTYHFGSFSFEQSYRDIDVSLWGSSGSDLDADHFFEVRNTLSYQYDFLNRANSVDEDLAKVNFEVENTQALKEQQDDFLEFFKQYMKAKVDIFNVKLNKEFVKRAQKRVAQVKRRVRDGLSREVELLQARTSLLNQKEQYLKARSALRSSLAILEDIVGHRITDDYFEQIEWKFAKNSRVPEETDIDHYNIKYLKSQLQKSKLELEKIRYNNSSSLNLQVGLVSNAFDENLNQSRSESFEMETTSKQVGLTYSVPLGGDRNRSLREKIAFNKKSFELDLKIIKDEIKIQKEVVLEQIQYIHDAYEITENKVLLADQTLKQQNALYFRGQASFEEVIRAEEAFIQAKLAEKKLLGDYDLLLGQHAYLNNKMRIFLNSYVD